MNLLQQKGQKRAYPASLTNSFRTSNIHCNDAASIAGREKENNLRKINNFQNILLCWEANSFKAQKLMFWATLGNKCYL